MLINNCIEKPFMKHFFALALLSLIISSSFFMPGCISNISEQDRLNSTYEFNVDDYINKLERPINSDTPCTCMACTKDEIPNSVLSFLGLTPIIQNTLLGSNCTFTDCNMTEYQKMLGSYKQKEGVWGECEFDSSGEVVACAPRFFMIGQGASEGEFSSAQKYCLGRLSMPVLWATSKNANSAPTAPAPYLIQCHLEKGQIPVIVWYSGGKYIDSPSYSAMLSSYNDLSKNPKIEGPAIITTEALADPYIYNSDGTKTLNISLLNKISSQLRQIKSDCPKCLSALALKPTFNETGLPDLCPINYFLSYRTQKDSVPQDPLGCSHLYPAGTFETRPGASILTDYSGKIDIIGIGFFANENENLTTCTPMGSISLHQAYSRQVLQKFYKPSVWYAVGMSEGATLTPGCRFSESQIASSYKMLSEGIDGFVASGIIGIAPYKYFDSYSSLQVPCKSQFKYFDTALLNFDSFAPGSLIPSSSPVGLSITVSKLLYSSKTQTMFEGLDGRTYLAYMQNGLISINETGCSYGFRSDSGEQRNSSIYNWFSACQYYFANRAPLFTSDLTSLSQVGENTAIFSKSNPDIFLVVDSIEDGNDGEVIFFAPDGSKGIRRFSAFKNGNEIEIYDLPYVEQTQQPLIFSTNGMGSGMCTVFEASKTRSRSTLSFATQISSLGVQLPKDEDLLDDISSLSCGGCLSPVPMPAAFCTVVVDDSFEKYGCIEYPEMDEKFLSRNLDPILMRSVAEIESLNFGVQSLESGSVSSPACSMSSVQLSNSCPSKDPNTFYDYGSAYCPAPLLVARGTSITNNNQKICALGVMQCIDMPTPAYNPFNPADSADCGARKFEAFYSSAYDLIKSIKARGNSLAVNDISRGGIGDDELEWYAAWRAGYCYNGMCRSNLFSEDLLLSYTPQDATDNIVKYLHRTLNERCKSVGTCNAYYGTQLIKTYNKAISKCNSGCAYNSCGSEIRGDEPTDDEPDDGDEEEIIVP